MRAFFLILAAVISPQSAIAQQPPDIYLPNVSHTYQDSYDRGYRQAQQRRLMEARIKEIEARTARQQKLANEAQNTVLYRCAGADGVPLYTATPTQGCVVVSTYSPRVQPRIKPPRVTLPGCSSDCSGHEAGYQWAARLDITEHADCGGNSNSFIEGCMEYVEEAHKGASGTGK